MSRVTERALDRRFLLAVTAVLVLATSLPFLGARLAIPAGTVPSGVYYQNSADWNVYASYAEQARRGNLFVRNAFSTEDDRAVFLFPTFVVAGAISGVTGLPSAVALHALRLLLLPLLVVLAATVLRRYGLPGAWRWALLLFLFAGGLGQPGEWPDLVPFLSFLFSPHYVVAWILALWTLLLLPSAAAGRGTAIALLASAITLLVLTQPFAGVAVFVVSLLVFGFTARSWRPSAWLLVSLLPVAAYQLLMTGNAGSQQYLEHNASLTAPFGLTGASLSILIVLALLSLRQWRRCAPVFLAVAGFAVALLIAPVPYQLRFMFLLPLALAGFGGATLAALESFVRRRLGPGAGIAIVGLLVFVGTGWAAVNMVTKTIATAPQYALSPELAAAIQWIKAQTLPAARIVSTQGVGNLVAGWTGRTVYVGHGVQTPQAEEKERTIRALLDGQLPRSAVRTLFAQHRLTHVLAPAASPGLQRPADLGLRIAFTNGAYAVYSVDDVGS